MHDMVFRGRGGGQFWAKDYKSHQVLRNVKLDEVAILIFCDLNLYLWPQDIVHHRVVDLQPFNRFTELYVRIR